MQTIQSTKISQADFKHIVSIENGVEDVLKIDDVRIVNVEIANSRGRAELLENGHSVEIVNFDTYYNPNLKLNDIISISAPNFNIPKDTANSNFIVKEIITSIRRDKDQATVFISKIKAVRYNQI